MSRSCGRRKSTRGLGRERNWWERSEEGRRALQVEESQRRFGAGDGRVAGGGIGRGSGLESKFDGG